MIASISWIFLDSAMITSSRQKDLRNIINISILSTKIVAAIPLRMMVIQLIQFSRSRNTPSLRTWIMLGPNRTLLGSGIP
jgi:hypothetical protein